MESYIRESRKLTFKSSKGKKQLRYLDISLNNKSLYDSHILELVKILKKIIKIVYNTYYCLNIDLSENHITCLGLKTLLKYVLNYNENIGINILKIYKNSIKDDGVSLIKQLVYIQKIPMEELHLSHNFIQDNTCKELLLSFVQAKRDSNYVYPRYDKYQNPYKHVQIPVWIRLEYNCIQNPKELLKEVEEFAKKKRGYKSNLIICSALKSDKRCCPYKCLNATVRNTPIMHVYMFIHQKENLTNGKVKEEKKEFFSVDAIERTENSLEKKNSEEKLKIDSKITNKNYKEEEEDDNDEDDDNDEEDDDNDEEGDDNDEDDDIDEEDDDNDDDDYNFKEMKSFVDIGKCIKNENNISSSYNSLDNKLINNNAKNNDRNQINLINNVNSFPLYIILDCSAVLDMKELWKDKSLLPFSFPGLLYLYNNKLLKNNNDKSKDKNSTFNDSFICLMCSYVANELKIVCQKSEIIRQKMVNLKLNIWDKLSELGIIEFLSVPKNFKEKKKNFLNSSFLTDEQIKLANEYYDISHETLQMIQFSILWSTYIFKISNKEIIIENNKKEINKADVKKSKKTIFTEVLYLTSSSNIYSFFEYLYEQDINFILPLCVTVNQINKYIQDEHSYIIDLLINNKTDKNIKFDFNKSFFQQFIKEKYSKYLQYTKDESTCDINEKKNNNVDVDKKKSSIKNDQSVSKSIEKNKNIISSSEKQTDNDSKNKSFNNNTNQVKEKKIATVNNIKKKTNINSNNDNKNNDQIKEMKHTNSNHNLVNDKNNTNNDLKNKNLNNDIFNSSCNDENNFDLKIKKKKNNNNNNNNNNIFNNSSTIINNNNIDSSNNNKNKLNENINNYENNKNKIDDNKKKNTSNITNDNNNDYDNNTNRNRMHYLNVKDTMNKNTNMANIYNRNAYINNENTRKNNIINNLINYVPLLNKNGDNENVIKGMKTVNKDIDVNNLIYENKVDNNLNIQNSSPYDMYDIKSVKSLSNENINKLCNINNNNNNNYSNSNNNNNNNNTNTNKDDCFNENNIYVKKNNETNKNQYYTMDEYKKLNLKVLNMNDLDLLEKRTDFNLLKNIEMNKNNNNDNFIRDNLKNLESLPKNNFLENMYCNLENKIINNNNKENTNKIIDKESSYNFSSNKEDNVNIYELLINAFNEKKKNIHDYNENNNLHMDNNVRVDKNLSVFTQMKIKNNTNELNKNVDSFDKMNYTSPNLSKNITNNNSKNINVNNSNNNRNNTSNSEHNSLFSLNNSFLNNSNLNQITRNQQVNKNDTFLPTKINIANNNNSFDNVHINNNNGIIENKKKGKNNNIYELSDAKDNIIFNKSNVNILNNNDCKSNLNNSIGNVSINDNSHISKNSNNSINNNLINNNSIKKLIAQKLNLETNNNELELNNLMESLQKNLKDNSSFCIENNNNNNNITTNENTISIFNQNMMKNELDINNNREYKLIELKNIFDKYKVDILNTSLLLEELILNQSICKFIPTDLYNKILKCYEKLDQILVNLNCYKDDFNITNSKNINNKVDHNILYEEFKNYWDKAFSKNNSTLSTKEIKNLPNIIHNNQKMNVMTPHHNFIVSNNNNDNNNNNNHNHNNNNNDNINNNNNNNDNNDNNKNNHSSNNSNDNNNKKNNHSNNNSYDNNNNTTTTNNNINKINSINANQLYYNSINNANKINSSLNTNNHLNNSIKINQIHNVIKTNKINNPVNTTSINNTINSNKVNSTNITNPLSSSVNSNQLNNTINNNLDINFNNLKNNSSQKKYLNGDTPSFINNLGDNNVNSNSTISGNILNINNNCSNLNKLTKDLNNLKSMNNEREIDIDTNDLKNKNKLLMLNNNLPNVKVNEKSLLDYNPMINTENFLKKNNSYNDSASNLLSLINMNKNKNVLNHQKINSDKYKNDYNTNELNASTNNNFKKLLNNENLYMLNKSSLNDINLKYVEALSNQLNFVSSENKKGDQDKSDIDVLNFQKELESKCNNPLIDLCEKANIKKL
ncbi:conserved Plasmodium protein, unknown function [Plasmodium relictum]|uniref:Uncharacterized protein n=1 Tax=Plasmodium relictum TaxID=85471 RepID=A0A1J1HDA3_PLARL|nr:conserved Plasmodium protein, unknown function [Plasmodium relictum]CRH03062.1 conserved Plasmodium protein, unknown function [Plasmodium relictum]